MSLLQHLIWSERGLILLILLHKSKPQQLEKSVNTAQSEHFLFTDWFNQCKQPSGSLGVHLCLINSS